MCAASNKPDAGFLIPSLTIRSESGGATVTEPDLLPREGGDSIVRSLKVEMGPCGELVRVIAELLPSNILLMLKNPVLRVLMDGQPVAAIVLADGSELRFD